MVPSDALVVIINADDWGLNRHGMDAIAECFREGRITSTTAMMFMEDSREASERAAQIGIPVGLHLNLTYPYTEPSISEPVRERQLRAVRLLSPRGNRFVRWVYNPLAAAAVDACIADQLEAFRSLYHSDPSHIDGHHHIHLSPNVLFSTALRGGWKMRCSHTFLPGEKWWPNRAWRRGITALQHRRHVTPDYLFDILDLAADRDGRTSQKLALGEASTVEIVCHPDMPDDRAILMSRWWTRAIANLPTGTYDTLMR